MKIGIIPKIFEKYKNQFEFSIELVNQLSKKIYKKPNIQILINNNCNEKFDLLIMSGGNDLPKHNKTKFNDLRIN